MRTTLSLDDDVAARIDQLRRELNTPLKELVNEALRRGLAAMHEPCEPCRSLSHAASRYGPLPSPKRR